MKEKHYYRMTALIWLVISLESRILHSDLGVYLGLFMFMANTLFSYIPDKDDKIVSKGMVSK